jgi:hypothetical protein
MVIVMVTIKNIVLTVPNKMSIFCSIKQQLWISLFTFLSLFLCIEPYGYRSYFCRSTQNDPKKSARAFLYGQP